jgi:hypothetical protein
MTLIHSWCTCGFPIKTSRTGRWRDRPSIISARLTRVKFRLGEPFRAAAAAEGWLLD